MFSSSKELTKIYIININNDIRGILKCKKIEKDNNNEKGANPTKINCRKPWHELGQFLNKKRFSHETVKLGFYFFITLKVLLRSSQESKNACHENASKWRREIDAFAPRRVDASANFEIQQ